MCLSLLTIIGAQAESVTFNVCSWDAKNKSVTITQLTHDCTPIEGQHWDWMLLPSAVVEERVTVPSLSGIMNTVVPVSAAVMMEMVAMSISTVAMSKPVTLKADDRKKLFLGANNKLYYPNDDVTINSFHAYLELSNDYIAGDPDAWSWTLPRT